MSEHKSERGKAVRCSAVVSQLRCKMNKQWSKAAQERINAELEGRSTDERYARDEMTWMRGYFEALKDVLANAAGELQPPPNNPK